MTGRHTPNDHDTAPTERVAPFRTWSGRDPFEIFPGVTLHAIGGEQVLLCRVTYEPGTTVARHAHEHTEQLMAVVEGDVTMVVGEATRTLGPGDVVVINPGIEHELRSEGGVTFFEALAPVPLDHVADPEQDLVLGPDGGRGHVER
jgi:quercetin dioxygenase-like cupin family protein